MTAILSGLPLSEALAITAAGITALAGSAGSARSRELDLIGALEEIAAAEPLPVRDLWEG